MRLTTILLTYLPEPDQPVTVDSMLAHEQFMQALPKILGPVHTMMLDFGKYDHRHIMRRKIRRCYR